MVRHAAILMLGGLLTGGLVSGAMNGQMPFDPHAILASHLNAMLAGFWIAVVAYSLPSLRLSDGLRRVLGGTIVVSGYGNWLVTALKAFWHVSGLGATSDAHNNIIYGLLLVTVVIPALVAAALWVFGLRGDEPAR